MSRLEPGYDFTLQAVLVSWVASLSIWVYLNIYYPPFDKSFDPLFGYPEVIERDCVCKRCASASSLPSLLNSVKIFSFFVKGIFGKSTRSELS